MQNLRRFPGRNDLDDPVVVIRMHIAIPLHAASKGLQMSQFYYGGINMKISIPTKGFQARSLNQTRFDNRIFAMVLHEFLSGKASRSFGSLKKFALTINLSLNSSLKSQNRAGEMR